MRRFWKALRPHAVGRGEGHVNTMVELDEDRVRAAYGAAKYDRRAQTKRAYDAGNAFHLHANIKAA